MALSVELSCTKDNKPQDLYIALSIPNLHEIYGSRSRAAYLCTAVCGRTHMYMHLWKSIDLYSVVVLCINCCTILTMTITLLCDHDEAAKLQAN